MKPASRKANTMSDLNTSDTITSDDARVTRVDAGVSGLKPKAPRKLRPMNAALKADPAMPQQPTITARDMADPAKRRAFIKAMREYDAAMIALAPRRTKQPIISDAVKSLFFADPAISNDDVVKHASKQLGIAVKLVTVKTFRGDAVNTFANADAAGLLSPAGRKWLVANRKTR